MERKRIAHVRHRDTDAGGGEEDREKHPQWDHHVPHCTRARFVCANVYVISSAMIHTQTQTQTHSERREERGRVLIEMMKQEEKRFRRGWDGMGSSLNVAVAAAAVARFSAHLIPQGNGLVLTLIAALHFPHSNR